MNELMKTEEYREFDEESNTWTPGKWFRTRAPYTMGAREGRKEALKLVLAGRGLVPTEEQLAVIDGCAAIDALEHWLSRVASVNSVAELLAD